MRAMKMKKAITISKLLPVVMMALALSFTGTAHAAAPGITGTSFSLTAQPAYLNQPDGEQVYSWGYGCTAGSAVSFAPAAIAAPAGGCPTMQVPGPTLIVTEGATVTVTLTNNLPTSAGNTSILFPGFTVTASGGVAGLLTQEAAPGGTVTYSFVASAPGTRAYYSGTQSDLQVEMGLYGAVIVLPSAVPANCNSGLAAQNLVAEGAWGEADFRLSHAAYDHPETCYDREYLFQFSEMDGIIHRTALAQVQDPKRIAACAGGAATAGCPLQVPTEPYKPSYFLINGRSMPDDMDGNYAAEYPHQPYNGNPHMHPGEQVLIRVIGQGRWEHPFHEHGNHVRILARDGNLLRGVSDSATTPDLSGLLMFTTDTFPGQSFDGIFYWTGRGLNWDAYGHNPASLDAKAKLPCTPDANGYNTGAPTAINYYEWCQDHNKPLQVAPFGDVAAGGPATLPDPNIFTNGAWYGGSPYLGPDATLRAVAPACSITTNANCSSQQPSNTQANPPNERGYAFMWHSHNEREITTNNVFPGGMLMMMLVDSREFVINEAN
jgi:FtsP/CotA-like multicopper oxidase with cupredoxin domain